MTTTLRPAVDRAIDRLLWLYWRSNKAFLAAFVDALLGDTTGDPRPGGKEAVERTESFLREVPRPVFRQIVAAVWLLPVAVPRHLPYSEVKRLLIKVWFVLQTHAARTRFLARGREDRVRYVDTIFTSLNEQAAEEEDDLLKAIVTLNQIKGLLLGGYMELESVWKMIGYTPFPERDWVPPSGPDVRKPTRTPSSRLLVESARELSDIGGVLRSQPSYCVIGSGAGGATAAWTIKKLDPKASVVLLEGGPLVPNDSLPLHLLDAIATLYMNGGTTLSINQKYTFRQARCVGGSTLVNNGVALKPDGFWWHTNIVKRWESLGVRLDWDDLYRQYDVIGRLINVAEIDPRVLTRMSEVVRQGFERVRPDLAIHPVGTNTLDCIGCGRCNLGCTYGAKQSMAESTIPNFVQRGGVLVPNAQVTDIEFAGPRGNQHVRGVLVEDGTQRVRIEADRFVLAAGAYASTKLLWRSGFTGARPGVRTVGKRFSGNFGTGVIGRFPEPLNGWAGQQVGYVIEVPEERMVIETACAPPPALGVLAPLWGTRLRDLIQAYDRLAVAIPVLGTLAYGEIKRSQFPSGFGIDFRMIEEDWRRLAVGLRLSGEALLNMGAEEVFTTRFDGKSLKPGESLDDYFGGTGPLQYLRVETAHLQGGNAIHPDPNVGVVDTDMRVHGVDNLWIADASVIPAPITLNIQLSVMALAAYAAERVATRP